jgi:hypothetical protein
MLMEDAKEKAQTSIVTAVSLDGSSKSALKIVMAHTDGSGVTLTTLIDITRDGMTYIRDHGLSKMFETSGAKAIVESMEIGESNGKS